VLERDDIRIARPIHAAHVIVIESLRQLGCGGQTIDTEKISKLIGATQGPHACRSA